jgi:hypothetical protein
MANPGLSDEDMRETVEAVALYGTVSKASRALGIHRATFDSRYKQALRKGFHLSEGARSAVQSAGLSGGEAKAGWIVNVDPETGSRQSTYWRAPEGDTENIIDRLRDAFEDIPPAVPVSPPSDIIADRLAVLPHGDVHIGMVVTADQTGGRSYSRAEAEERFKAGVSQCIASTPPCHTAIIINAGDMLHANDDRDVTPRSGHKLKVEGTHAQNFDLAVMMTAYKIDLALQHYGHVIYRGIPGNHDPNIPYPLSVALRERYRDEPRAEIIVSEDEFWQRNWGDVFLSGHHGHGRNPKDVCQELPGRFSVAWGEAKQWHYFSAHKHNYQLVPRGPVLHHQLPSVCSADTHAAWSPYPDTAGMVALTFDKKTGLKSTTHIGI